MQNLYKGSTVWMHLCALSLHLYRQLGVRGIVQVAPLSSPSPHHSPCDLMRCIGLMADGVAKPVSIIFENLWQSSEVPSDWGRGNITHTFKKAKNEKPEKERPVSLTMPRKTSDQIPWKHMEKWGCGWWQLYFTMTLLRANRAYKFGDLLWRGYSIGGEEKNNQREE